MLSLILHMLFALTTLTAHHDYTICLRYAHIEALCIRPYSGLQLVSVRAICAFARLEVTCHACMFG